MDEEYDNIHKIINIYDKSELVYNKSRVIMMKCILKIEGMHCDGCAKRLENGLKQKEGIISAKVEYSQKRATIEYEKITRKEIEKYIGDIGFQSVGE